jgi:hypothetical protein
MIMTTVVFVHGTGTREPAFSEAFHLIEGSLHTIQKDIKTAPCFWGETLGTKLYADGASIPLYDSTRNVHDIEHGVVEEDYQVALWEQLYRDPLYELRLLTTASTATSGFIPGQSTPGENLDERVKALSISSHILREVLEQAGILNMFDEAKRKVIRSQPYLENIRTLSDISEQASYNAAIARAIIATAIALSEQRQHYTRLSLDAALRDDIIQLLCKQLGDDIRSRSIGGWVAKQLFGLALAIGMMDQVQRKRGAITGAAYPFAGDVLLYQGRGNGIRSFIQRCVQQAAPPVVLLAHSLGGVACVDLLIMEPLPEVKLLITVGSQAPFFYEINALHSLRYSDPLPSYFPDWLNIYDLRDFLSYVGAGVFHEKVQDVLVDSKQPFPQSHSAYWTNPATWKAIAGRILT